MTKKTKNRVTGGLIAAMLAMGALPASAAGTWGSLGSGLTGTEARYLYVWGDTLVVAGKFDTAGGQPAHNIAMWDGVQWAALGEGWDWVGDITMHNGQLAVSGLRPGSTEPEIALWDGNSWTTVVKSVGYWGLASYKGKLYQGSEGYSMSLQMYWCALWEYDGSTWTQIRAWTSYPDQTRVSTLRVFDGELYMDIGPYGYIYSYDGTTFTPYSSSNIKNGAGLIRAHGEFYVAGQNLYLDAAVCRWNGTTWEIVFYQPSCCCLYAMTNFNDDLVVAGWFGCTTLPGQSVLAWNGSEWSAVGGPMNKWLLALAVYRGKLIAGGVFTEADSLPIPLIAEYLGTPTAIGISKFRAHASRLGVELEWDIAADEPIDGFAIYRSEHGTAEKPVTGSNLSPDTRSYTDRTASPGNTYRYVLVARGGSSGEVRSQTIEVTLPAPKAILYPNIPNPFNPETTIRFDVAEHGHVAIDVYAPDGKRIRSLVDAAYAPGEWSTTWDGTDQRGNRVASGVYYYRMRAGKTDQARKMVLLK